jgi:hypothetical protein
MAKKKKKEKKAKKKGGISLQAWILILGTLATGLVFIPSTLLLGVGMLPTIIAMVIVRKRYKNKVITIGSMNFAGCFPYLLGVWQSSDRMGAALSALSEPMTIVVMYSAAGAGYLLNWGVTNGVRRLMLVGAEKKLKNIDKEKEKLEKRWGRKVRGDIILDVNGFPVEQRKTTDD